jgi:RNA polymerase sigma-70 factor (ECF subfamily)
VTAEKSGRLEKLVTSLFDSLRDPVYRYLYRLIGNQREAEDLVQETFLRLYIYLDEGHRPENTRAWVFRVAHNLAVDKRRKRIPVAFGNGPRWDWIQEHEIDPAPDAEQNLLQMERRQRVRKSLTRLSPQERHCLDLRTEGLCYREIAEVLGIRPVTVVTFLRRAIQKIIRETHE